MFALVAMICFILALFMPTLGPLNLAILGAVFVAAHLAFGWGVPWGRWRGNPNQ